MIQEFPSEEAARKWVDSTEKGNELDTTVDEWRDELARMEAGAPGKTVAELAGELGVAMSTVRERLRKLVKEGRCTKGMGRRTGSGGAYTVSVYQLKKEEKR